MGGANSKKVRDNSQHSYKESLSDHDADSDDNRADYNKLDEQYIQAIKKDLSDTPELFVLNNLLMSIMFFENYQKTIEEASVKRHERDETCIAPDAVLEKVNKYVTYRPLHGPKKHFPEPLVARRLYVLNDSIKVDLDLESYHREKSTVQLEESLRKGFMKLREVETSSDMPIDEEIPIARTDVTPSTSRSSETSTDSDTIYGYATLSDIKTPKPIDFIQGLEKEHTNLNLPGSCIAYRRVKKIIDQTEMNDEEVERLTEEDMYDIVSFISSKGFMKYFQNSIFPNSIGTNLGFVPEELRKAKSIPGKIFCNKTDGNISIPCEVIPCLPIQWPDKQTLKFLLKGQKPPEARKRYIFPTQRMIDDIKALNCVLVPKGYLKKKGEYLDGDIEWEIHFPQAERYLETFMSHAQAKCFLFLLALHKTYIEPRTMQLGLLAEHIRHFMLWECEFNYSEWPEHRLGTKLIQVIKKFNGFIAKRHLPDYFVSDKNVFESASERSLMHAQKYFHDVLESPVMSFIKSLRNLRYTKGPSFYPTFDFGRLYEILVKTGMESTNQELISELSIPPNYRKKRYTDSDAQLRHIIEVKRREKIIRKRQEKTKNENLTNTEERRESVDSINMDWSCENHFDRYKKRILLTFFIEHFIDIADKCRQISTRKQTLLYLKQAMYLTTILGEECSADGEEVDEFMRKIKIREDQCNGKVVQNGENVPVSEETNEECLTDISNNVSAPRASKSALKMNGVGPRKSVVFAENH